MSASLISVLEKMEGALRRSGRSLESIRLMAVTKTRSPEEIEVLAGNPAVQLLGENKVQEAVGKIPLVKVSQPWEMIGHLQKNKVRQAVKAFSRIQSVDSLALAERINRIAGEEGKAPYPVLLQVNTGADPGKDGIDPTEGEKVISGILEMTHLRLEGLMTIGPLPWSEDSARQAFAQLRQCRDQWEGKLGCQLTELSMGMSSDFEIALEEGSTLIRLGSILFGPRE